MQKIVWKCPEAVLRRCTVKRLFLRISENSQENTCTQDSFYQSYRSPVLSCEFCEIFKSTYFVKDWWTAAYENHAYLNSIEQFPEFQSDEGNQKFRITCRKFYMKFCPKEKGITYVVKNLVIEFFSVLWWSSFLFSRWRLFGFLNFMKTWPNLTKTIF